MKEILRVPSTFALFALAFVVAGCATPPPIDPASLPRTPAAFKEEGPRFKVAPATAPSEGAWWNVFHDPALGDLMRRADRGNTSIQVAAARLAQARALAVTGPWAPRSIASSQAAMLAMVEAT